MHVGLADGLPHLVRNAILVPTPSKVHLSAPWLAGTGGPPNITDPAGKSGVVTIADMIFGKLSSTRDRKMKNIATG